MNITADSCPKFNSPEFIALEDAVGRFDAVKDWIEHKGVIRTPEEVLRKIKDKEQEEEADLRASEEKNIIQTVTTIEQKLKDSGAIVLRNDILFVVKDRYPQAINIIAEINKTYGPGTVTIESAKTVTGAGGRSIDKVIIKPVGEQFTAFSREKLFFLDPSISVDPVEVDAKAMEKAYVEGDLAKMTQAYSESTGIVYRIITPEEAIILTNKRWNGEKGFYLGETVCLVKGLFTKDTVFHEFSHPTVRAIRYSNTVLFNKLFDKALTSSEGQNVRDDVKLLYATPGTENYLYDENSDDFKEEVIVRAMEAHFKNNLNNVKESEGFIKFIKDLLYAIKQQMRKIFGQKIAVDKLNVNTSIETLAEMLSKGDKFDLSIKNIKQSDVEAYAREQHEEIETLKNVDKKEFAVFTEKFHSTVLNHLRKLRDNPNYEKIAKIFSNEIKTEELSRMKGSLGIFKEKLDDRLDKLINDVNYTKNLSEATVNSLYHLEKLSEKIKNHLQTIAASPNDKDGLQQMSYYQGLLNDWAKVISDIKKVLSDNNVAASNKLYTLVNTIQTQVDKGSEIIQSIRKKLLVPVIHSQLSQMGEFVERHYKDGYLTKEEYDELKLTPERISLMLEGKISEDNNLNSFLEGYMNNQDPIVASAAKYINDNYTDVIVSTQKDLNEFAANIKKDLENIGYTGANTEELGKKVTYLDEIGYKDASDNFVTKKVRSFLSKVGNWRAPKAKREFDISELRKQLRTEENRKAIRRAEYENDKHKAIYFNNPLHPEFYENLEFFADEIGQEARDDYDEVRREDDAFKTKWLSGMTPEELKAGNEAIRVKYNNLYSIKTATGELKSERDQEKAKRLQLSRDHNKKFFERAVNTEGFKLAYNDYKQYLTDNNYNKDAPEGQKSPYDIALDNWVNDNTVKKLKPEYKERIAEIQKKLAKLSEGIGKTHTYFNDMYESTFKFRDEDFQIDGNRLLEKDEVLAEKILEWETLMDKEKDAGIYNYLSGIERVEFFGLINELRGLKQKAPTQAYLDTFNAFLEYMDLEKMHKATGSTEVNLRNIGLIVKDEETIDGKVKKGAGKGGSTLLNSFFKQSPEFEAWFKKAHRKINKLDEEGNVIGITWERSYIWNTTEPVNQDNYESVVLETDGDGNAIKTIQRAPGFRFTYSQLKPTFKDKEGNVVNTATEKIVGETVDNKGEWLPKSLEQGAPVDSPYINQAYYDLKNNDPRLFKILEKTSKFHLKNQNGLGNQAKLYLDLPRYEKNTLETIKSGNILTKFSKQLNMWFTKSKDDAQRGFNWEEVDYNIAKSDMFDQELSAARVPIYGTAMIDEDVSSADIFGTTTRYMLSAAMHRKKVEMLPTFTALKSVLSDPENALKEITNYTKSNELNRGIVTYKNKTGKNVRLEAVTALMDRELGGQNLAGSDKDLKWLNQTMGFMMHRASFGFFALNAPSAIKNSVAAHMQIMMESAAGWYLTPTTYGKGIVWAGDLMAQISGQTYEIGPKSLKVQLSEIFDPTRGRQEEKFGDSISRSFQRDVVDGSWLYNFRKWTEMHATMTLFGGMMYKEKVNRTVNGRVETIDYADAWELNDKGQIVLKDGVDPAYGVNGTKFKDFRERVNTVSKRLQGAYARFDQPEANRYLLFRMVWFLRKFFMPMLMDRWAFRGKIWDPKLRYDIGTGELTEGYYITFTKLLLRTAMSVKYGLPKMNPMQKRSVIKITTEVLSLYALSLLWNALFDYDPDDEDRFEKIKNRSGVLPIPGIIDEDPQYPFHLDGWLANHTLNTMIQVKAENDQWLPFPGLGLDNYMNTLYLKSFAYGPTIEVYVKAITDLQMMTSGDQRAYYKEDVGPYNWQKEEQAKVWNHLAKMWGISGTTADPALMTKYSEWMQEPGRR